MVSIMEKNNEEDRWWLQDIIQKGERKILREARRGDDRNSGPPGVLRYIGKHEAYRNVI